MLLFPLEENVLKMHREYPASDSRRLREAIALVLFDTKEKYTVEKNSGANGYFDFIDEYLYEFCMDNRMYSDYSYQSDPKFGEPPTRVKLDKMGLGRR